MRNALVLGLILTTVCMPCLADVIELTSGEKLIGEIVSETDAAVVINSSALGKIEVPRDRIQRLQKEKASAAAAAPVPGSQKSADGQSPGPAAGAEAAIAAAPASPTEAEKKREDLLRMYWDEGLRYQISQPITVPNFFSREGENVIGEEVRVSGRLGIKLSVDAAAFSSTGGEPPLDSDLDVRAFRLYTNGELGLFGRTLYAVQFGVVSKNFYLHEAYLKKLGVKYLGDMTFGYMTVPQTLENVYPFGGLTYMEAASPSLAFAPGNRMGLQLDRTFADQRLTVAAGIFSVGADPGLNFGDASQSLLRPTLRVTGLPVLEEHGDKGPRLLHLGVSVSYILSNDEIQYHARPESFLAPFLVDTGVIKADTAAVGGLEALYIDGPWTVQSEYLLSSVDSQERNVFAGWYLSSAWLLTGETRPYDKAAGALGTVRPKADFSWKNKTWGAWEIGLRYSHLNLNSGSVRGGDMKIGTVGLNWYWNRYVRWQFNYEYAAVSEGPAPGNLQIFQGRLQLTY